MKIKLLKTKLKTFRQVNEQIFYPEKVPRYNTDALLTLYVRPHEDFLLLYS